MTLEKRVKWLRRLLRVEATLAVLFGLFGAVIIGAFATDAANTTVDVWLGMAIGGSVGFTLAAGLPLLFIFLAWGEIKRYPGLERQRWQWISLVISTIWNLWPFTVWRLYIVLARSKRGGIGLLARVVWVLALFVTIFSAGLVANIILPAGSAQSLLSWAGWGQAVTHEATSARPNPAPINVPPIPKIPKVIGLSLPKEPPLPSVPLTSIAPGQPVSLIGVKAVPTQVSNPNCTRPDGAPLIQGWSRCKSR